MNLKRTGRILRPRGWGLTQLFQLSHRASKGCFFLVKPVLAISTLLHNAILTVLQNSRRTTEELPGALKNSADLTVHTTQFLLFLSNCTFRFNSLFLIFIKTHANNFANVKSLVGSYYTKNNLLLQVYLPMLYAQVILTILKQKFSLQLVKFIEQMKQKLNY